MGPLVRLVTISLTILVILNWFNLAKCDNVVVSTYRTYFLDDICIQFELYNYCFRGFCFRNDFCGFRNSTDSIVPIAAWIMSWEFLG